VSTRGLPRRQGQEGQASVEYTVVLALCVAVLIASTSDSSTVQELVDAIKSAYRAYSFVISYSV